MARLTRRKTLLGACALAMPALIGSRTAAGRTGLGPAGQPKILTAFYYDWFTLNTFPSNPAPTGYQTPAGYAATASSGQHWLQIDQTAKTTTGTPAWPASGPYDSRDNFVTDAHVAQMQAWGINCVALDWWGPGTTTDIASAAIRQSCRKFGLNFCMELPRMNDPNFTTPLETLTYLAENWFADPLWQKTRINGFAQPILFLNQVAYQHVASGEVGPVWAAACQSVYKSTGWFPYLICDLLKDPLSPGSPTYGTVPHDLAEKYVDMVYLYVMHQLFGRGPGCGPYLTLPQIEASAPSIYQLAASIQRQANASKAPVAPVCQVITPRGYGDIVHGPSNCEYDVLGYAGATMRVCAKAAISTNPDIIAITSFNEEGEGTGINPTLQFGSDAMHAAGPMLRAWLAS